MKQPVMSAMIVALELSGPSVRLTSARLKIPMIINAIAANSNVVSLTSRNMMETAATIKGADPLAIG